MIGYNTRKCVLQYLLWNHMVTLRHFSRWFDTSSHVHDKLKSTVYYDVLHQKVLITRLCYPVKIWTDLSCSKTWHNLYRMITPHRHVGYALCRYILHYGEGEGYSISLFFVRFLFSIFGVWIWITGDVGSGVDDVQGHPRADLQMFRQSPFQIVSLLT